MNEAMRILGEVSELLAVAVRVPMRILDDETAVLFAVAVEEAGRLVDALRLSSAAELDERSRYELGRDGLAQRLGETRGVHLLEKLTRVSQREAARRVRLGRAICPGVALPGQVLAPPFPVVAGAVFAGALGLDAAATIVHALTQAARRHASQEGLDAAELALVEAGTTQPADLLAVRARVWREALDPDGAEPRDETLHKRRELWIGREENGMTRFGGYADPINAAALRAALAERSGPGVTPRFLSEDDRASEDDLASEASPGMPLRDPRTREQRQFDIVFGLITAGLRSTESTPANMRSLTTVVAVITLADLEAGRGVGWLDDVDEPVSAASIHVLACDAGVKPLVLGANGEALWLGRTQRLFSKAQRLALAVRDGGCVWNGCHAPPGWCHAHHVLEYAAGGKTDMDNGVLLCPEHHHALHASEYRMAMRAGRPYLLAPFWLDPSQTWQPLGKTRVTMAA